MTVADWTSFAAALAIALTGSIHCVGMCGGFALSASIAPDSSPDRERRFSFGIARSQLLYHLGKTTSYVFLGMLSLWTGTTVLRSSSFARSSLFFACGAALLLLGAASLGWRAPRRAAGSAFVRLTKLVGWTDWMRSSMSASPLLRPIYLGMLSGLLPCPLVWAFLATAAVSTSPVGALGPMLALGLGTVPALAIVAWSGKTLTPRFGLGLAKFSGVLLIVLGCWTWYRGFHPNPACCG